MDVKRLALMIAALLVTLILILAAWMAQWPTPALRAWQLRRLAPGLSAAVTGCALKPAHPGACQWVSLRLYARANRLRPAGVKPLKLPVALPAREPQARSAIRHFWRLGRLPGDLSRELVSCYGLGEIEGRAPPSVEARYQACRGLALSLGRRVPVRN